jgi:hypothetical protein
MHSEKIKQMNEVTKLIQDLVKKVSNGDEIQQGN